MKKILLLVVLFLTSGCTVNYNLTIDKNNNLYEEILVQTEDSNESLELYSDPWPTKVYYSDLDSGESPEKLEGVDYYKEEVTLNNGFYQKKLFFTPDITRFNDINSIKSCYEHFYFTEDKENNTITLSTSPEFLCMSNYPSLKKVNIKLNVSNPVKAHNAKNINGNTYEWTITKENYKTSGIIITFFNDNSNEKIKTNSTLIFGFFIAFCITISGVIFYKVKAKK